MNPFTRICCPQQNLEVTINNELPQSLTANRTGVQSRTDTENTTLNVVGDVSVDGRMHIAEVLGDTFLKVSDQTLKKDIKNIDLQTSLDILRKVNPVTFKYKSTNKESTGVVAQELQKIEKTLVHTTNGLLSVDYDGLNIHAIKAVQYLLQQLEEKK